MGVITAVFGAAVLTVPAWLVVGSLGLVIISNLPSPSLPERYVGGVSSAVLALCFLRMRWADHAATPGTVELDAGEPARARPSSAYESTASVPSSIGSA